MRAARNAAAETGRAEADGEEVPGKVAVRAGEQQAVRPRHRARRPAVFGRRAGNHRIEPRQLVHQLTGALHDRLVALTRGDRLLIGAAEHHSAVPRVQQHMRRLDTRQRRPREPGPKMPAASRTTASRLPSERSTGPIRGPVSCGVATA